jgi:hypothetical protein
VWLSRNDAIEYLLMRYGVSRAQRTISMFPPPKKGPDGQRGYDTLALSEWAEKAGARREDRPLPSGELGVTPPPPDVQATLNAVYDWTTLGTAPKSAPRRRHER